MTSPTAKDLSISNMTPEEWQSRVDCAAGYRLMEMFELTDLAEGMVGLRVSGEPDAYLIQEYGMFFDEITASNLVKVRFDEEPDAGPGRPLNYSSCAQVKCILQARPDLGCVIHTHTKATSIVASLKAGLMPLNQFSLIVLGHIVYVDYDPRNNDETMREIVEVLGEKKIVMIRNHGVLVTGITVAEAIFLTRTLEVACQSQIDAMKTGGDLYLPEGEITEEIIVDFALNPANEFDGTRQWDAFLRRLDRVNPGYDS